MAAVLRRKAAANVYPQIGHFFCNLEERRVLASPDGDKDADPLLVSLHQEGSDMMADLRHLNLKPQYCYRGPEPINLYHKVGHGTLDMYVLNPSKDSKYVRDFLKKWHNSEQKLFEGASASGQFNFPIPNLVSICALLVWRPANPDDTITRIMFPGSTPQHKIFEGLEKLKHLEFLQHPTCTGRQVKASPPPTTSAATTTTTRTTKQAVSKTSKERTITTEKKEDKTIDTEPISTKISTFKDETDSKNVIDNKLLNELVDGDDKKIESVLQEAIIARAETKLDDKIAQYENAVIDSVPKKKDIRKKKENVTEKKTKRIEKTDETKDSVGKIEVKKTESKVDSRKRTETRAKSETVTSISRSKVSHRASMQKSIEKKVSSTVTDKKGSEDKKSPPATPKKSVESKTTAKESTASATVRVKTKARKLSPGSTPAKSTKEANNRRVVESKYKQASPKRDVTSKPTEKKEVKKREPISRRPRPLASPVKGIKAMKSPTKSVKSVKVDPKLKGLQRVNYEDILRDAKKSDEETSKSLDDFKQDIDDKEEQEIVREIEAVFNRDSEAEEKIEYIGRSDIEKITCLLDNTKTEVTGDSEFEEEYLIIEKEEIDQFTEDSIADRSSNEKEDELKKHTKDKEESEKRKEEITIRTVKESEIPFEVKVKSETITHGESKQPESKEHSVSVEEKQDLSSEKKTSDSKSGIAKPKDSLENIIQESQPDEKVSTTIESGATTTAPTLPEDERITLDEIKEDQLVEEKHVKEDTKEQVPPHTQVDVQPPPSEKSLKLEPLPAPIREIVKTPDEVADLPLHEEVDYRTYEEKKTPGEEDVFKRKPDVGFVHEIRVPKDLPLPDKEAAVSYSGIKTIQGDIVHTMVERPSHAELVTVTPGSAPESPMYPQPTKDGEQIIDLRRELEPVKEYESEYNYGEYTEKLRETHITTLDSPIKDDIIIVEETASMPEKIPSIPEDVEKEIEEARTLEGEKSPIKSPKEVLRIVADVAEVLKSDKSLEEIIAGKTPIRLKSPEHFFKSDMLTTSTIESTISFLTSESETKDEQIQKDAADKTSSQLTVDATNEDSTRKEISPVRSVTSEDISDVSDKTVLSEGKRSKREVKDEKLLHLDESKVLSKEKVIADSEEKEILDKDKDQQQKDIQVSDIMTSSTLAFGVEESIPEKRVSLTHDSAKTLERLDEKLADLKKKDEIMHQKAISKLEDEEVEADALDIEDTKIKISFDTVTTEEATSTFVDMKKESASRPENVEEVMPSPEMAKELDIKLNQKKDELLEIPDIQETDDVSELVVPDEAIKVFQPISKEDSVILSLKDAETSAVYSKKDTNDSITTENLLENYISTQDKESSPIIERKITAKDVTKMTPSPMDSSENRKQSTLDASLSVETETHFKDPDAFDARKTSLVSSEKDLGIAEEIGLSPVLSEKGTSLSDSLEAAISIDPTVSVGDKGLDISPVISEKHTSPTDNLETRKLSTKSIEIELSPTEEVMPCSKSSIKQISPIEYVKEKISSPVVSEKSSSPIEILEVTKLSKVLPEADKPDASAEDDKPKEKELSPIDEVLLSSMTSEKVLSPIDNTAEIDDHRPSLVPSEKDSTPVKETVLKSIPTIKDVSPAAHSEEIIVKQKIIELTSSEKERSPVESSPVKQIVSSPVISEKHPSPIGSLENRKLSSVSTEKELSATDEIVPISTPSIRDDSPVEHVKELTLSPSQSEISLSPTETQKITKPSEVSPVAAKSVASAQDDMPTEKELILSDEVLPSSMTAGKDLSPVFHTIEKRSSLAVSEKESSPVKETVSSPVISGRHPSLIDSLENRKLSSTYTEMELSANDDVVPISAPSIKQPSPIEHHKEIILSPALSEKSLSPTKTLKVTKLSDVSFEEGQEDASAQLVISSEKVGTPSSEASEKLPSPIPTVPSPIPSNNDKAPILLPPDKDVTPSPVIFEKESSPPSDKEPSPAESEKDKVPSEAASEKEMPPSIDTAASIVPSEKDGTPSPGACEKTASSVIFEKESSPVPSEKEPSPAPSEMDKIPTEAASGKDGTPSPGACEKTASSVIFEKESSPVPSEKEPSPAPSEMDKIPTEAASGKDGTPSPEACEKTASPVPSEKESSPAHSDKDKTSGILPSEKVETPSSVISEKEISPSIDTAASMVPSEKDGTPSPGLSEKTSSPVSSEKESSPALSDKDKTTGIVASEKDEKPSPVISEKEISPSKYTAASVVPSEKDGTPSPVVSEKQMPPSKDTAVSVVTSEKEGTSSPVISEKGSSPVTSEKESSPALSDKDKTPDIVPSEKVETPSPVISEKEISPSKDTAASVVPSGKDGSPSPGASEKTASPVPSEKESSPALSDKDKTPGIITSEKEGTPSPVIFEKESSPVPSEKELSLAPSEKDKVPSEAASEKEMSPSIETAASMVPSEKDGTPSPGASEKTASPVPSEKESSPALSDKDKTPGIVPSEKVETPSSVISEKEISLTIDTAASMVPSEKDGTPSPGLSEETASPVPSEKVSSPALTDKDKTPGIVPSEKEGTPSPVIFEKESSPVPSEKEPSPAPSEKDKVPSEAASEKEMSPSIDTAASMVPSEKDGTPSPVIFEKESSRVPSEKEPSPAPSEKDKVSSEAASEKEMSPSIDTAASMVPSEEHGTPSPEACEKTASPVPSEKKSSPAHSDKDKTSGILPSEKVETPSSVISEKEISPSIDTAASMVPSEKDGTPSPGLSEKTASPVPSEKESSPALSDKDKTPGIVPSEKEGTPSPVIFEKESSPVPSDKEPSPAPSEKNKVPSEAASEKEMSPSIDTAASMVPSEKDGTPSPVIFEKESNPVPSEKEPSPAPSEKDKVPSEAASEKEMSPSIDTAASMVTSEKDGTPSLGASEKTSSPVTSEKESSPALSDKDKTLGIVPSEKVDTPSSVISEKEISPRKDTAASVVPSEKDGTSSPVVSEKQMSPSKDTAVSVVTSEKEGTPSPVISEKESSPVMSEKESSPALSDKDKTPGIVPSEKVETPSSVISEKEISPSKDTAASVVPSEKDGTLSPGASEKTDSPVPSEKESSPVLSDTDKREPSRAPSEKDEITSEVASEKEVIPSHFEDKTLSLPSSKIESSLVKDITSKSPLSDKSISPIETVLKLSTPENIIKETIATLTEKIEERSLKEKDDSLEKTIVKITTNGREASILEDEELIVQKPLKLDSSTIKEALILDDEELIIDEDTKIKEIKESLTLPVKEIVLEKSINADYLILDSGSIKDLETMELITREKTSSGASEKELSPVTEKQNSLLLPDKIVTPESENKYSPIMSAEERKLSLFPPQKISSPEKVLFLLDCIIFKTRIEA
ncbi:hypothetical protein JYU34_015616 [Plutella xylostella]|uniref:Microtubule-associated protein 1A/B/S-like MBL-like domain-containing protein n=1 Tax=Plutella xylostella TaxID=51655 RepID=A0ABQ7Q4B1_PLUXY|nr:hypothetical protein JYU34_015616 [Plutella xylostella]